MASITPDFSSAQALREFVREELDQLLGSRSLVSTSERLQIVRGIVTTTAPGTINSGQGFNLARLGVGYVRVSFQTPFVAVPTALGTNESGGSRVINAFNATPGAVEFFGMTDAGVAAEVTIHFACFGSPVV